MTDFEIYVFILCFIVFSMFALLFTYMITTITQQKLLLIRNGIEDEAIKKEYSASIRKGCARTLLGKVVSLLLCLVFCVAFIFSAYMNVTQDTVPNGILSLKVVKSDSMSRKHENNTYLIQHGLNDQIQTFDIIVTRHLPPEDELNYYDIVVYEQDGIYVVHRIVGIEEPNKNHPEERHFLLQGDALESPDRFPVLYSQMQGIYKGERIPFAGSFVLFLQSPAGWLCILLVLFAMVATPVVEKKLQQEVNIRLKRLDEEENQSLSECEEGSSELAGIT